MRREADQHRGSLGEGADQDCMWEREAGGAGGGRMVEIIKDLDGSVRTSSPSTKMTPLLPSFPWGSCCRCWGEQTGVCAWGEALWGCSSEEDLQLQGGEGRKGDHDGRHGAGRNDEAIGWGAEGHRSRVSDLEGQNVKGWNEFLA